MIFFKNRYRFNENTMVYEKIPITIKRILGYTGLIFVLTVTMFFTLSTFYNTPKERRLKDHIDVLVSDVYMLNRRTDGLENVLSEIETMDSVIYRSIFDTDPFYREYDNKITSIDSVHKLNLNKLVDVTHRKLNRLERKITDEYYDLEHLKELSIQRQKYLESVPSIQPVSNERLKRTASGWGYRIHPIYKIRKFHYGLDFAAKTGTSIYATGNSKVYYAGYDRTGYGKIVILDHGYGYKTLYAHMSSIHVKKGETINRGEVIGEVGSSGSSTGPHLHYEVIHYGKKVNPIQFFFNDLTIEEYDRMIKISSKMNKTFD